MHGQKAGKSRWGRGKKNKKLQPQKYKDFEDERSSLAGSGDGGGMNELQSGKKQKKQRPQDEEMDVGVQDAVRAYRHEKPARVGGLNKHADGNGWDGSAEASSDLLSNREKTPTSTPTKVKKERNDHFTGGAGGIRKVESMSNKAGGFWSRATGSKKQAEEHIKAEAKKLQDMGRAAQRHDFSFQNGDDAGIREDRWARRGDRETGRTSRSPTNNIPGSFGPESEFGSEVSGDTGTKSYHHPIPGLNDYAEERRKKRNGGYRRGMSDDEN